MSDAVWYLKSLDLFKGLRDDSVASIAEHGRLAAWGEGEVAVHDGDAADRVFVVIEGRLEVSHPLGDGRRIILAYLTEGAMWGLREAAADDDDSRYRIRAVVPSRAFAFAKDYFMYMIERRPRVAFKIIRYMGLQQRRFEVRITNLIFKSNLQKLGGLVLELMEEWGRPAEGGVRIGLRLKHEELGNMIGLNREQTTKLLRELKNRGVLADERRRLIVRDPDGLRKIVG